MQLNENWKSIVGYEDYEVSDEGHVRSLNYNHTGKVKVLKFKLSKNGYLYVTLCKNGKKKMFSVHRLVVTTFRGPIPRGLVVNHLNENKLDNRLSNLEVCTVAQNNNHGTHNERVGKANSKSMLGNTNARKQLELANAFTKYSFPSTYIASEFFGYKGKTTIASHISKARRLGRNFIKIFGEKYYFSQEA